MFIENKYKKWYDMIIANAKNREYEGYVERHHIIPRCMGGTNDTENIAELTAREHFLCHWLLTKCVSKIFYRKKMQNALGKFVQCSRYQERNLTSRQYEIARKAISEANKNRFYSEETRKIMSEKSKGRTPWNKGLKGSQKCSDEKKALLSELYIGKTFDERFGEKATLIKEKISETKTGKPSGMLGKTHSPDTRKRISENNKGKRGPQQRTDSCPFCSKENVTARHIKFCQQKN